MQDETYNGWKNYPTWAVNLWLSNDQALYTEALGYTADAMVEAEEVAARTFGAAGAPEGFGRSIVGDALRELVTDIQPDMGASLWADLAEYALDCVDWLELADAWITDVKEQDSAAVSEP